MADITIGPGGLAVSGEHNCATRNFLGDTPNSLGTLKNLLTEQQLIGITTLEYTTMGQEVDNHMPMRASTSNRVDGVVHYRTDVGYDGLLNTSGAGDATPETGTYTDTTAILDACGVSTNKGIAGSINLNSEACNPSINGPRPLIGQESYSRELGFTRLPIPALCFMNFVNKEAFYEHLSAVLRAVRNGVVTRMAADDYRWMLAHSRFNVSPVVQAKSGTKGVLPDSPDLFTQFTFGRMPEHYGSADWMASMLRYSELPQNKNVTVRLPVAIFKKYKEQLATSIGMNFFEQSSNFTKAINGFIMSSQGEDLIYQDEVTGRRITFKASTTPVYVEVEATGPAKGSWQFQEQWVARNSETANQIFRRENPNYGRSCSCTGKVLAAIVTVTVDGEKPFYAEPAPDNNPDTRLRSLIGQYAKNNGVDLNTTLGQVYPTSAELKIWTGIEAQRWVLDPINQRLQAAGSCEQLSNIESTWIGGYAKMGKVRVENNPRQFTAFMLRMPKVSSCVELIADCADFDAISAAGEIEPVLRATPVVLAEIPEPVEPTTPPAGTISPVGNVTKVTASCTDLKTVVLRFVREGGSYGALSITVTATPSAHANTIPSTVNFADGQTQASISFTVNAWAADPQEVENFTITYSGAALDAGAYTTRLVCIKSNPSCPGLCVADEEGSGCPTC